MVTGLTARIFQCIRLIFSDFNDTPKTFGKQIFLMLRYEYFHRYKQWDESLTDNENTI